MLRIGLLDKKVALSRIHRLMLIEESVIGVSQNWITYGSLISLPPSVIANGIMPFLLLGAFKGCYKTDTKYSTQVINIAKRTTLKTLIKGLGYALTTGSFISLGLEEITLDTVFSENIGYSREYNQYYDDLSMIQYISCALAFFNHLARHPRLPVWVQDYGRYGSNISNTLGSILLDYFATFSIMGMILELTIGDALIYRGCKLLHWRGKLVHADYVSQAFFFFVNQKGWTGFTISKYEYLRKFLKRCRLLLGITSY